MANVDVIRRGMVISSHATIGEAVDAATMTGDIVEIYAGTYSENVTVLNSGITIRNRYNETVIVNGAGGAFTGVFQIADGVQNVLIMGDSTATFAIMPTVNQYAAIYFVGNNDGSAVSTATANGAGVHAVITGGNQDGLSFTGNIFGGNGSKLVYVNGQTSVSAPNTNVNFIDNIFSGDATGPLLGIESLSGSITGNIFSGETDYALLELWEAGLTVMINIFSGTVNFGGAYILDSARNYNEATLDANNTMPDSPLVVSETGLYTTIQGAIDDAQPGETILLAADDYAAQTPQVNVDNLTFTGPAGAINVNLTLGPGATSVTFGGQAARQTLLNAATATIRSLEAAMQTP